MRYDVLTEGGKYAGTSYFFRGVSLAEASACFRKLAARYHFYRIVKRCGHIDIIYKYTTKDGCFCLILRKYTGVTK